MSLFLNVHVVDTNKEVTATLDYNEHIEQYFVDISFKTENQIVYFTLNKKSFLNLFEQLEIIKEELKITHKNESEE